MAYSTPELDTPVRSQSGPRTVTVEVNPPATGPARRKPKARRAVERRGPMHTLRRSPLAFGALILLGLIILGAVLAPWLSPYDKDKIDLTSQYLAPSLDHPFGTDDLGRDIFVRVMHGGRVSLSVGFLAMFVALLIGVVAGGLAGYYGRFIDADAANEVALRPHNVFFPIHLCQPFKLFSYNRR